MSIDIQMIARQHQILMEVGRVQSANRLLDEAGIKLPQQVALGFLGSNPVPHELKKHSLNPNSSFEISA